MKNLLVNYAISHKDFLIGLASGYALSHIPQTVGFIFSLAMKLPFLRAAVIANPAESKAVIDAVSSELKKDIDSEASVPESEAPKP